jgi:hypothetical protein
VTGVGGTQLFLDAGNAITDQLVWNDTTDQPGSAAGGGLSHVFFRPSYQRGLVGPNDRSVPDVSMLADVAPGYAIYCSNRECTAAGLPAWQTVGGTSAATPLLAGGFALVDQLLRARRRQDLGFVNPLLYQLGRNGALRGQVFSDVTRYGNDVGPYVGNHRALGCCDAASGFDDASGWGSVQLTAFAAEALQLQPPIIGLSLPGHQHPVRRRAILATVSCTGACRLGAYALVTIGRSRPVEVDSSVYVLRREGRKTAAIRFNGAQLARLRGALRRGQRIHATVYGVLLDPREDVISRTGGKGLVIRG